MLGVHTIDRHRGHVKLVQDAERYQRGNALPVGRNFMQRVAPVIFSQRCDPFGLVGREVTGFEAAAVLGREFFNRVGNRPAVIGLALGLGNRAQSARSGLELKQLAHIGRAAPRQERIGKTGQQRQLGRGGGPLFLHHRADEVTALGDVDGWLHQVRKRQFAKTLGQRDPAGHGTRHGDRVHAAFGWVGGISVVVAVFGLEVVRRPAGRGAARSIQAVQCLAVPQQAERVTAQPVADRLDDGHGGSSSNRRINRIAAAGQHGQPSLRGQRV